EFSRANPCSACSLEGCACKDNGSSAERIFSKKGSLLSNSAATFSPSAACGSAAMIALSGSSSTVAGPPGCAPYHNSAIGKLESAFPCKCGMSVFESDEEVRVALLRSCIDLPSKHRKRSQQMRGRAIGRRKPNHWYQHRCMPWRASGVRLYLHALTQLFLRVLYSFPHPGTGRKKCHLLVRILGCVPAPWEQVPVQEIPRIARGCSRWWPHSVLPPARR